MLPWEKQEEDEEEEEEEEEEAEEEWGGGAAGGCSNGLHGRARGVGGAASTSKHPLP